MENMNGKISNKKLESNKGITLGILVITVIVLSIITAVTIDVGREIIDKTELETLKTNMYLIEAKVKIYQEEVSFKSGITNDESMATAAREEVYVEIGKLIKIEEADERVQLEAKFLDLSSDKFNYYVTEDAMIEMGLSNIDEAGYYIISFDDVNMEFEIYSTQGYMSDDDTALYSLTELENE